MKPHDTPRGMDSSIPSRDRAMAMLYAILEGVQLTREEAAEVWKRLPKQHFTRKRFCVRGHARIPGNVRPNGECAECHRTRVKQARSASLYVAPPARKCACGHALAIHDPECYYQVAGSKAFSCDCAEFRP